MNNEPIWMKDQITSAEQLRESIDKPHEAIVMKSISVIDETIRDYVSKSSIFFLATSSLERKADVSPRGDEPGFVKILDEKHLAFPDRPGNRRADSLQNIIENPQVGMIFVIPGSNDVLRINGRAVITRNEEFIASQGWDGKMTGLAVVVEVEECFVHCPRAFKQGGLWSQDQWIPKEEHPNTSEMFKAHLAINGWK
ncbi:phosphohydrolase [Paenibacillus sp. FSL H7-0326]|uniref:MSMEG_1061 family FMN-dependent PPOX-type flavoprotein n=1 Tax=Paenibacillus sp. FSL H7-0326 TaxID=1921144 RepID=UPI00096DA8A5|nr:MSMEG_1061 family FMN-dependent PPOX-type flavoprotein [Paenibacillus sp. FSL H7-0326]OMC70768.1 phosphohydrolase [Paenibacillus sp. FSL H7-0326]